MANPPQNYGPTLQAPPSRPRVGSNLHKFTAGVKPMSATNLRSSGFYSPVNNSVSTDVSSSDQTVASQAAANQAVVADQTVASSAPASTPAASQQEPVYVYQPPPFQGSSFGMMSSPHESPRAHSGHQQMTLSASDTYGSHHSPSPTFDSSAECSQPLTSSGKHHGRKFSDSEKSSSPPEEKKKFRFKIFGRKEKKSEPCVISTPFNVSHQIHVDFSTKTGFVGLPPEWEAMLSYNNITKKDVEQDPDAVLDVLKFESNRQAEEKKKNEIAALYAAAAAQGGAAAAAPAPVSVPVPVEPLPVPPSPTTGKAQPMPRSRWLV